MRPLSAFVFDRRYSVPTLRLSVPVAAGAEEAVARAILEESAWYQAVELRAEDTLVAVVRREAVAAGEPRAGPDAADAGAGL